MIEVRPQKIPVVFYRTASGKEIVRDWLRGLRKDDREVIGQDLMRVQYQWPTGMPICRSIGQGSWELRSEITGGRIARIMLFFAKGHLVAMNGFVKTTQKTPPAEIALSI